MFMEVRRKCEVYAGRVAGISAALEMGLNGQ